MTGHSSLAIYILRRFKLLILLVAVLMLVSSVLESVSVIAFFPIFLSLLGQTGEDVGGVLGFITRISELIPASHPVIAGAILLTGIALFKAVFNIAREVAMTYAAAKILYDTQTRVMARYAGAQYQFHLDNRQGELIYNCVDAAGSVGTIVLVGARIATALFKALMVAGLLFLILPLGAASICVVGLIYYVGIHYISQRVSRKIGVEKARVGTEQLVISNEFFSGFRQIVTTNTIAPWTKRFNLESRTMGELMVKESVYLSLPRPVLELFAVGLTLGMVLLVSLSSPSTVFENLPTIGIFAVALAQMIPSLTAIGSSRMLMMVAMPRARRAFEAINDPMPMRQDGHRELSRFETAITFENVNFSYNDRNSLLDNINLTIEKGKVTAFVGSSGAGKTTIINLILGLFQPIAGKITVDGILLQEYTHASWLNKLGFVSQDPFMHNATISDNIRLGRSDITQQSVVKAATIAKADEFINQLPQAYETLVGDKGMRLSGGQQQRIAIARALLTEPEILIFDEATSSLDTLSEKQVQEAIEEARRNRTVIVIAHRLSTVRHADKIIVFEQGKLLEQGNHQELLSNNGQYSKMVSSSIG